MNRPITLCDKCKEYSCCCLTYDGDNCRRNRNIEPTNADRIRSMTDEELAEYLYHCGTYSEHCYGLCSFQDECEEWQSREFCIKHITEWLKQEVK